jgi:hypothetical protein
MAEFLSRTASTVSDPGMCYRCTAEVAIPDALGIDRQDLVTAAKVPHPATRMRCHGNSRNSDVIASSASLIQL